MLTKTLSNQSHKLYHNMIRGISQQNDNLRNDHLMPHRQQVVAAKRDTSLTLFHPTPYRAPATRGISVLAKISNNQNCKLCHNKIRETILQYNNLFGLGGEGVYFMDP